MNVNPKVTNYETQGYRIFVPRKDSYQSGVSEYFPEKIEFSTGKIDSVTGKIIILPN